MRNLPIIISGFLLLTLIGCQPKETTRSVLFSRELNKSFQINPAKDTIITGENGTIIEIPAHAFVGENGEPPRGTVEITFVDFYDKSDFVLNRLSTQTVDGRLLQSSGMVFLEAHFGNQQLKLIEDQSIRIKFRRTFQSPKAGLFYGQENEDGVIEWVETGEVYKDTVVLVEVSDKKFKKVNENDDTVIYVNYKLLIGKDTLDNDDSVTISNFLINNPDKIIYSQNFPGFVDSNEKTFDSNYAKDIYFTFNSLQLGWINCDDFINQDTHDYIVDWRKDLDNVEVYIIFDSLNTVMNGLYDKQQNSFYFQVPDSLDITLVAWQNDAENPLFAMLKSNTSKSQETIALQPMPADSIKMILKERL